MPLAAVMWRRLQHIALRIVSLDAYCTIIVQRDLHGDWVAWIEIGSPSPERLHKASKTAPRVQVSS